MGNSVMHVRDLRIQDLGDCYRIICDNWNSQIARKSLNEMSDKFTSPQQNYPPEYCVIELGNIGVLGCAGYRRSLMMTDAYELIWNNVHKDYRRLGIGTKLLEYRMQKIKDRGGKLVTTMSKEIEFLTASGFHSVSMIDGYFLMVKRLAPIAISG